MYAVIFRATIRQFDQDYFDTARKMHDLAMHKYGCQDFVSLTEGEQEITISYWNSLEQIQNWRKDPDHQKAQAIGQKLWYRDYNVQITKIEREYQKTCP